MTRTISLALAAASLLGCVNDPVVTHPSNNAQVHVDELFSHDGCTVYRFQDGWYHYYVRCRDDAHPATLSCMGKGCRDDDRVQTIEVGTK